MSTLTMLFDCRAFGLHLLLLLLFASNPIRCVSAYSPRAGCTLNVLVPRKHLFPGMVDCSDPMNVRGFCIDVFESALSILTPSFLLRPPVNYSCMDISITTPYNDLIHTLLSEGFDAAVGDITISANRSTQASFTQPFLESGIVILSRAGVHGLSNVLFLPFTRATWGLLFIALLVTGMTLWWLESNEHSEFQLPWKERVLKSTWLITSWVLSWKRESLVNPVAKVCLIAWMFFILLLSSGYTASLTSLLTVGKLSQQAWTMEKLALENRIVGYQVGSIVEDVLVQNGIKSMVPLESLDNYTTMLSGGEVIVEEAPYVSLFLAEKSSSDCKYSVSSKQTSGGFGFAFQDDDLASAFSVAILNLSENGQMQKLQEGSKLSKYRCPSQVQSSQLDLRNSYELFILLAVALCLCFILFLGKGMRQHNKIHSVSASSLSTSTASNVVAAPAPPAPPPVPPQQQMQHVQLIHSA